jgi:hypothetical protein
MHKSVCIVFIDYELVCVQYAYDILFILLCMNELVRIRNGCSAVF